MCHIHRVLFSAIKEKGTDTHYNMDDLEKVIRPHILYNCTYIKVQNRQIHSEKKETNGHVWMEWCWGGNVGKWGVTKRGQEAYLWGDENILKITVS